LDLQLAVHPDRAAKLVAIDQEEDMDLKNLTFRPGVIRTLATDLVIERLDPFFGAAGHRAEITSVLRTQESQLQVITDYARMRSILKPGEKLNFADVVEHGGKSVPRWQLVWSTLLSLGVLINPPRSAAVLTDYFKDGENRKGQIIQPSSHFLGKAFDIGGRGGDPRTAQDEYDIIMKAAKTGIGIKSVVLERANNCVHCNV
jgi:hypothetical protein